MTADHLQSSMYSYVFVCLCAHLIICLPVSERCDDKTVSAAEELILVDGVHVTDGNDALILILTEVRAGLLQPLKVTHRLDVHTALQMPNRPMTCESSQF